MLALSASAALQFAILATGAQPYDQAATQAGENGQPLLVLVGADWCPGCRTMKHSVLTRMESRGSLKKVNYATVNTDQELALASRLMRGNSIPQLIIFSKTADGQWHREQITGTASEGEVASMIERARSVQVAKTQTRLAGSSSGGN
jgi:thioredoxin-like negative regulator of GroEL